MTDWRIHSMKLTKLRVNHVERPIGFQMEPLSFSWIVEEAGAAKKKKRTRICISETGEDGTFLYDSGELENADSMDFRIDISLKSRTRYRWIVEVTADNGEQASAESWFETGKKDEPWEGSWITASMDADTPAVLRKKFEVRSNDGSGRLYVCGLGVYEIYLNGRKVGNEYLAPGYHSYDFHLQAQTYDVSDQLLDGENEIQIWLGDGWFRGRLGFDGGYTNLYGNRCYAIAELYSNGELAAATDESWQSKPSPVIFSNIYDGETYDAALEAELRKDTGWSGTCREIPHQCGRYAEKGTRILGDRYSLPIVKKEEFVPVQVIETPKGETVLDFGQNLTGWVEFDCALPAGESIRLAASEILQDGCFYRENLRTAKAEFLYRSAGKKAHVRPHFTFYGFRYMKAEHLDAQGNVRKIRKPEEFGFTAYHLRSDFDQIGWIRTGNEKVNRLFANALWGQKDNFLDVPTDCPQRDERLGWTGDAQIFSETACCNMYMPAFYRKYLWDMRAEQSILDGSVPNVVPRLKEGMVAEHGSCPWADAGIVIPWNLYQAYGDKTLLEECYSGMKAWIDCERKKEEALGGLHLIKDGFHFADWLALDNEVPGPFGATDPLYIASTYYYMGAKHMAEAAEILGYQKDADNYGRLADEILKAIQITYFDEDGLCVCRTQTGSAIAVMFGLNPTENTGEWRMECETGDGAGRLDGNMQKEGDCLAERVKENHGHLNTGFVGTTMLAPALTETGHHELAVDLLLNEDYPGWLYSVNLGATTIWERWNSVEPDGHLNADGMNSLNHYSYGSIEAWMYRYVCGIRPETPGYQTAVIAPHPDRRLGFAECTLETAAGVYKTAWKYVEDGKIVFDLEIPFGTSGRFTYAGKTRELEAGTYQFTEEAL